MGLGRAPQGSSPQVQEALGLNEDVTFRTTKSEGERLRDK